MKIVGVLDEHGELLETIVSLSEKDLENEWQQMIKSSQYSSPHLYSPPKECS